MATPQQRKLAATIAANDRWAFVADRTAATAPGRAALEAKFERQADPDGIYPPEERARRVANVRHAYYARLALASTRARMRRKNALPDWATTGEADTTTPADGAA